MVDPHRSLALGLLMYTVLGIFLGVAVVLALATIGLVWFTRT